MTDDLKPHVWPIEKADTDAIYKAIRADYIADVSGPHSMRIPIEVQTPLSRLLVAEVQSDWRLFGITWVATEFIQHDSFRLIYNRGPLTEHKFDQEN